MSKKNIVVIMGGMSSEHDVSIASGAKVAESLDRSAYDVVAVTISREGMWHFPEAAPLALAEAVGHLARLGADCVFIALHGPFGEDGRLQGMLDLLGLPYTSSGCIASGLAMDKVRSKAIARDAGVPVAGEVIFDRARWESEAGGVVAEVAEQLGFPCVVKSPCQGSSLGLAIVQDEAAFRASIPELFGYDDVVLAEKFVAGVELTCAVLDIEPGVRPRALPLTEIRPVTSSYFDYEAKYTPGASREITPAEVPEAAAREVQDLAVRVHEVMGCAIWSRSDFILTEDGPVWLEVNTIPGMTPTSLYPQAAEAVGISYTELLGIFVEAAIRRRAEAGKEG